MTVLLRDMFVVLAISLLSFPRAKGHGYMTGPRSVRCCHTYLSAFCCMIVVCYLLSSLYLIHPQLTSCDLIIIHYHQRNLLAFQETVWWPVTETDPQPETCPQCLNRGGSLAQCGISQEMRNYDAPL